MGREKTAGAAAIGLRIPARSPGRLATEARPRIQGWHTQVGAGSMDVQLEVLRVLDEVLSLGGRALRFGADTPLLGSLPDLDSMAVVSVITTLQDRLGVFFHDDDIDGESFRTVGDLTRLVGERLASLE